MRGERGVDRVKVRGGGASNKEEMKEMIVRR